MTQCPKCQYVRKETDAAPVYECPSCGVVYAKVIEAAEASRSPVGVLDTSKRRRGFLALAAGGVAVAAGGGYWWLRRVRQESERVMVEQHLRSVTADMLSAFNDHERTYADAIRHATQSFDAIEQKRKEWYAAPPLEDQVSAGFRREYAIAAQDLLRAYRDAMSASVTSRARTATQGQTGDYGTTIEALERLIEERKRLAAQLKAMVDLIARRPAQISGDALIGEGNLQRAGAVNEVAIK